jgi:hypothetical protein
MVGTFMMAGITRHLLAVFPSTGSGTTRTSSSARALHYTAFGGAAFMIFAGLSLLVPQG